jgi:c-di-GMP-binding flagellar brake protein YcgR
MQDLYLPNLERGLFLELEFLDGWQTEGILDDTLDHLNFYLRSPEIVQSGESIIGNDFMAHFEIQTTQYSFPARIEKFFDRHDSHHDCALCRILGPIKGKDKREDFRIQIALRVRIFCYSDDHTKFHMGELMCEAVSVDVSKNGMSLWCDHMLPEELDARYTLEFKLNNGRTYLAPAKLRRHARNTETRSYMFVYGFLFDFTGMPTKQEDLLLDILEHKIRAQ